MNLALSEIADLLDGRLVDADATVAGVATDTRSLEAGALFIALRGERFDGHEFVHRAASLGAAGALVAHALPVALPQVVVADTLAAMQRLAAAWRVRSKAPLVAVTGSNGKTTVKEMLAAILGQRGAILATRGNLNNHIGVPLTLLALEPDHAYAVVEMGASAPGEIALAARLARPSVAVITNAADAHLEGFGSREGVARAKGELFADLAADGVAVINADDDYAGLWSQLAGDRRRLTFGLGRGADVTARDIEHGQGMTSFTLVTPSDQTAVALPLAGSHNVSNALAAAAVAAALNVPLAATAAGLAAVAPVAGRLQWRSAAGDAVLIDDTYNANPMSLAAALAVLAEAGGTPWLVLGDMGELGAGARAAHIAAGRAARAAGVQRLFATGELSAAAVSAFGNGGTHYPDYQSLVAAVLPALTAGITVLVKGSRSAGMERVVVALAATPESRCQC